MTDPPSIGALYLRHRDAMYRVAASVLREGGRAADAEDAVSEAIKSVLTSPPAGVLNWEAFLVTVAKRKAHDILRSAASRHAGPEYVPADHDQGDGGDIAQDVAESIDRQRSAALAWDGLSVLEPRERHVVWEVAALERSQADLAAELGISRPRVNQILKAALARLGEEMKEGGE